MGASEVMIYHHVVRNTPFNTMYGTDHKAYKGPVLRPHVDMAPIHAPTFLKKIRPQNHEDYKNRRWQIMNLWRPLDTVLRDPLAVADARTVPESDELMLVTYENTPMQTEIYLTQAGAPGKHQWYYYSEQQVDDVLAFKIYDSAPKHADVSMVPHTSFRGVDIEGAPPRYSIEVRCFIAYD